MPFELEDDFGDDDALLSMDVDAMAAARRAAPLAGARPGMGPPDARVAPARHPPKRMAYPHELPGSGNAQQQQQQQQQQHNRVVNNPAISSNPTSHNEKGSGFSGHCGKNGGFSRPNGSWHTTHDARASPKRWRSGHDAVDRATASGAVRGNTQVDPHQRTVNQMFNPKSTGAQQRTLDGMFGGDKTVPVQRSAIAVNVARSIESNQNATPNHATDQHAHLHPISIGDDDWDVGAWTDDQQQQQQQLQQPSASFAHQNQNRFPETLPQNTPTALGPSAMGTPDTNGLVKCLNNSNGMRLEPNTAQTYVYPGQLVRREYQFDMTRAALTTNALVCLPTGLGKTLIAAVVMKNFHRWFPKGKVVFLAPTRPLVEQQKAACRDICGMPEQDTCTLMGSTKRDVDGTRRSNWRDKRLFFCTPQTMENDLRDGVCPASEVVCLVIDEAHRAKGNHAYCGVVKQLWERQVQFRLLALTATPGHDVQEVQQVVRSLAIGRIDFRSDQDEDVKKHTHKRMVKLETVVSTKADMQVLDLLRDTLRPMVKKLLALNAFGDGGVFVNRFADGSSKNMVKPYTLLKAQNEMRGNRSCQNQGLAFTIFQKSHFIAKVAELLTTHTPRVAVDYVGKEDQKLYVGNLFREYPVMREALDMLKSMAGKGAHHSPKMGKLQFILKKHFARNGEFSRVMIFTSFRDSVHDIVRACREMSDQTREEDEFENIGDPSVDPGKGQGTITGLFKEASGSGVDRTTSDGTTADRKDSKSSVSGHDHRVKVAAFIGQGDTSKGGAGGAGAACGTKGQSQKEQKAVLDAFRHGSLNTVVATSIGEEGLDIPAVDLIVFFDVVDIIRTIQRMGRTGRARDGNVVVLATEGKEAQKFKTEYDKYEYMLKSLGDPGRVFDFCNDCPRMLPPGHDPAVEFLKLGPSPEEMAKKKKEMQKSAEKSGGKTVGNNSGGARGARSGKNKDPYAFHVRPWDAPLTIVETSLLAAYQHPPDAMAELDIDRSAPFQRRATPVYNVPHCRLSVALMRGVSKAQGLPPPRDTTGKVIEGGAIAKAREQSKQLMDRLMADAAANENPPEAHFAPPVEWAGDEWEPPAAAAADNHEWSEDEDVWDPPALDDSREYVAPPYEEEGAPGQAAAVDPDPEAIEGQQNLADQAARDVQTNEVLRENENDDDQHEPRVPTGATQRLDFSTQPRITQDDHAAGQTHRTPLADISPASQLTAPLPVRRKSPTAAESARRRLAVRASQQSQRESRQSQRSAEMDALDDDDDDETVGDIAFHIEQRRLAALAKRRSASAARSAEKRERERLAKSAEKSSPKQTQKAHLSYANQARVFMPPPPPRASPAVTASPATTVGGWGWDGATPVREDDTGGWGGGGCGGDASSEKRPRDDVLEGDTSMGWGTNTQPSDEGSQRGSPGWGAVSPNDIGERVDAWGAPSQPSQDLNGGAWGASSPTKSNDDADDWGAWESGVHVEKVAPILDNTAVPSVPPPNNHTAPTPDSEDLRVVKRRKRRVEDVPEDDVDDFSQPSLNPKAKRVDQVNSPVQPVGEKSIRSPSRRAALAASRREKRNDAAKAAVARFVDDEASGDDDVSYEHDDGWCTEDEEFVVATQETHEDQRYAQDDRLVYREIANANANETPGGTGSVGGISRVISKFGPRSRLDVSDTPSPTQLTPGHTPVASQYGGSFVDDDSFIDDEDDDGVGRVLSGGC